MRLETMSNTPDDDETSPRDARRGLIQALAARLGFRGQRARDGEAEDVSQAAADLMDHAQAFQRLTIADVMTPRADITAVELSTPFEAVVAAFAESEHSRLPVYRETLDDPVGVAHLKDLFKLLAAQAPRDAAGDMVLPRMKRETLYVPPSMRAADLLVRMQTSRIHMAMVIDEFGGVDGLVTLEDVIEAVVGEIDDEHDEAAAIQIVARAGGVFEVDARVDLEELEAALGRRLTTEDLEEEIDTAAGLVTALAGRVPQRGEVIAHPDGLDFEITDADPRRVKRLRIRPTPRLAPPSEG
jgi:CBS domain containing-hemolysin-like protein